jgi:DNA repair exonuclease SbcCD ATPase subunit
MRIRSVTVRNYRVHRQLTVHFEERLTVIGGPNESGKSTLVEAIHRALFMRHKAAGADLDGMRSHFGGHPEVELTFEAQGRTCTLRKQFRGQSGSATLEEEGQAVRRGDDAEQRLAELIGESEGARRWSRDRWSHLWVWQQQSFEDPSAGTNDRADDLVRRFQESGAAVVQLSSRDAKLAAHFASQVGELFNKNGTPKRGTELDLAVEAHEAAQQEVLARTAALEKLYDAARRLESARAMLREVAGSIAERERELQEALDRQQQVIALSNRSLLEEHDAAQKHDHWELLSARERTIKELREQVALLTGRLAPMQQEATRLSQEEQTARVAFESAVRALTAIDDTVRATNAVAALADDYRTKLDLQRQQGELDERAARVREASESATRARVELAALADIDATRCKAIDDAVRGVELAETKLEAIATRVELLRADGAVHLGSESLSVGAPQIITTDTELSVGEGILLRITPGGGASVADAEHALNESRHVLTDRLQAAGVASATAARELLERRNVLSGELTLHERRLEELAPASLDEQQRQLTGKIAEVTAAIGRRIEQAVALAEPASLSAAQQLCADTRAASLAAEEEQQLRLTARKDAQRRLEAAQQAREAHAGSMVEQQRELDERQQALAAQLSVHGSDVDRAEALVTAEALYRQAAAIAGATEREIEALDPAGVDETVRMASAAVSRLKDRRVAARDEELLAQRDLQQDGSRDPHAELSLAQACERETGERLARVRLRAEAIRELAALYAEEQKQLAEQFSQPLRARADKYLRVVLPDCGMHVEYDNREFGGLAIVRGATRTQFAFDTLSTGAREQVATALRLGVAEVLAEAHGGVLPLVFDDAFAYSDPDRLKLLRRMLFRAAESGLQIIVLSCNAVDYDGLGTRVTIERAFEASMAVPSVPDASPAPDTGYRVTGQVSGHVGAYRSEDAGATDDADQEDPDEDPDPIIVDEEDANAFLEVLARLGGRSGNQSLRQELGWDEDRYDMTRMHLLDEGAITLGKGRGGSVVLVE